MMKILLFKSLKYTIFLIFVSISCLPDVKDLKKYQIFDILMYLRNLKNNSETNQQSNSYYYPIGELDLDFNGTGELDLDFNGIGELDLDFNGTGIVTTDIGAYDYAYAVAIQNDGKIVAAGTTRIGSNYSFAVVRYK